MTSKPFGVNITLLPAIKEPDYVGYAKVIVEEGINIVETAGNNPLRVIDVFQKAPYKIYIIHKYLPIFVLTYSDALLFVMQSPHKSSALTFFR
jgi:hypothetical protein